MFPSESTRKLVFVMGASHGNSRNAAAFLAFIEWHAQEAREVRL